MSSAKKTATITVDQKQAAMLLELVSKGAVSGAQARSYADLYDTVKRAADELGAPQG
jgi:hypothetical protein